MLRPCAECKYALSYSQRLANLLNKSERGVDMHTAVRNFIRLELSMYTVNKEHMSDFSTGELLGYRQLLWVSVIRTGIEAALLSLPAEIRNYVQVRYFDDKDYNNTAIAEKLGISERTVDRWDKVAVESVCRHIGVLF